MRRLQNKSIRYYWELPPWAKARKKALREKSNPIYALENCFPLGPNYADAIQQAAILNAQLDEIRFHRGGGNNSLVGVGRALPVGSFDWLCEKFFADKKFKKISMKQQNEYRKNLQLARDLTLKSGNRFGQSFVAAISAKNADQLYERLEKGPRGPRIARATATMAACRRAWNVVHRAEPKIVPLENPFEGMELTKSGGNTVAATLQDLDAYVSAADALNLPSLGTAALIAYFWIQREADIIQNLKWGNYQPHSKAIVRHNKTKKFVPLNLVGIDEEGQRVSLFPELEARLSTLSRGPDDMKIIRRDQIDKLTRQRRDYSIDLFQKHDRLVRSKANLVERRITFASFRHGGHTEAANAGATDRELEATGGRSGSSTLATYVKHTTEQSTNLNLKRLAMRKTAWESATAQMETLEGTNRTDLWKSGLNPEVETQKLKSR